MARIIYKEGLEVQNRLECIEGIEIELLNGQCALIYPKYANLQLLDYERTDDWKAKPMTEIEALKVTDSKEATDELLALDSPAAEFVRKFKSDIHGRFNIPTLLAVLEISHQMKELNKLSKVIEGADLLEEGVNVSSCSRYGSVSRWFANSYDGFASGYSLYASITCIPAILYRKA